MDLKFCLLTVKVTALLCSVPALVLILESFVHRTKEQPNIYQAQHLLSTTGQTGCPRKRMHVLRLFQGTFL